MLSRQVGCSLLCGTQSRPLVELVKNPLPNGSDGSTLERRQTPKQDIAQCCNDKFDVVSFVVCNCNLQANSD